MAVVGRTNAHNISIAKPGKLSEELIWRANSSTLSLGDSWQCVFKMGAKTGGKRELADARLEYTITNGGAATKIIGYPGAIWSLLTGCNLYINGVLVFELPSRGFNLYHRFLQNIANDSMTLSDLGARCYEELEITGFSDSTYLFTHLISGTNDSESYSNSLMHVFGGVLKGMTDANLEEIRLEFTLCTAAEATTRLRWDVADIGASFSLSDLKLKLEFIDHPEPVISPNTPILLHTPKYFYRNYGNVLATTPYRFNLNTDFPRCRMKRVYIGQMRTGDTQINQLIPMGPVGNNQLTSLTLYRNGVEKKSLATPARIFANSNKAVKAATGRDLLFHSGTYPDIFQWVMLDFTGLSKDVYALGDSKRHFSVGGASNVDDVYEIKLARVASGYLASDLVVVVESDRLHRMNGTRICPVEDKATGA